MEAAVAEGEDLDLDHPEDAAAGVLEADLEAVAQPADLAAGAGTRGLPPVAVRGLWTGMQQSTRTDLGVECVDFPMA